MDIDLLFTPAGEAGLISRENLVKKVSGAVLDTKSGLMTLEYTDMDYLELNIPVDAAFFKVLDSLAQIHIGAVKDGHISQAYQIPLMFADDPYRAEALKQVMQTPHPLQVFGQFIKRCASGQPVHRADLGNEATMGCVLGDASPQSLQFAPHLARRHAMEVSPRLAPGHGPAGPGLGGSSSAGRPAGGGNTGQNES